ncbi:hypothetical protein [Streptomyces chrestomyceticus]|uniref:hypothetical protein n=1 Tax=Streptomyces chrestomyceticus TaxID=68185 RepID=UPI0019D2C690|nr:hypothetical protein [Streptomyces chrestomyceticus]
MIERIAAASSAQMVERGEEGEGEGGARGEVGAKASAVAGAEVGVEEEAEGCPESGGGS